MNMVYSTIKCGVSNPISRHKKRLDGQFSLYQTYCCYMCGITYFDTICVHLLKSAYSLLKMRTAEKRKNLPTSRRSVTISVTECALAF